LGWSKTVTFVTGLLNKSAWKAPCVEVENADVIAHQLINKSDIPSYWVRKDFVLSAAPGNSVVTIVSANYFELYINGQKASDDVLTPAVSDVKKQLYAITFYLSRFLRKDDNCIALWMGLGWANDFAFSAQLNAQCGAKQFELFSDESWVYRSSPLSKIIQRQWNNFGGERLDASALQTNWNLQGTDTQSWLKVKTGIFPTYL